MEKCKWVLGGERSWKNMMKEINRDLPQKTVLAIWYRNKQQQLSCPVR